MKLYVGAMETATISEVQSYLMVPWHGAQRPCLPHTDDDIGQCRHPPVLFPSYRTESKKLDVSPHQHRGPSGFPTIEGST